MQPKALLELGLRPHELGVLTVDELDRMFEESGRRFEQRLRIEARWVALLMNATGRYREPVTVESLLGRNDGKPVMDEAAIRARAEARMRERLRERAKKGNAPKL